MKLIKLSLATAIITSTLLASEAPKSSISVSGDVTFTSNSLWRGGSGTNNSATVQGTLGVEHESGVYAGMWGTGTSDGSEIDLYIGYATEVSGLSLDIGFVDYITTQAKKTALENDDYYHDVDGSGEVYLGASYDVGVELGAKLYVEVLSDTSDSMLVDITADKDFGVAYVGAVYGLQLDSDSDGYYGLKVGKAFESIKGDLSFNYQQSEADDADAVYAISYTTSF